jgi:basic membrane protein A
VADIGALRAVHEHQQAYVIGLLTDYYQFFPEEIAPFILTSILKRSDQSVLLSADAISAGIFKGGTYFGTLKTGEVDLAPFYDKEHLIPEQIKVDLEQIKADIIAGKILTKPGE